MAIVKKVTFEITEEAAELLRDIKVRLEQKRLPVKQRHIVEQLIRTAQFAPLLRHFSKELVRRIGEDEGVLRTRRNEEARRKRVEAKAKFRRR